MFLSIIRFPGLKEVHLVPGCTEIAKYESEAKWHYKITELFLHIPQTPSECLWSWKTLKFGKNNTTVFWVHFVIETICIGYGHFIPILCTQLL